VWNCGRASVLTEHVVPSCVEFTRTVSSDWTRGSVSPNSSGSPNPRNTTDRYVRTVDDDVRAAIADQPSPIAQTTSSVSARTPSVVARRPAGVPPST
jgi:hypothetical protein